MKNLRSLILILFSVVLISCNDDNDGGLYGVSIATVISDSPSDFRLLTDYGNELTVLTDIGNYVPSVGQRAVLSYEILNQVGTSLDVDVVNLQTILTKDVDSIKTDAQDLEYGNDAITVNAMWCAGGYLNIDFYFLGSGRISHRVSVVQNSLVVNPNDGKVYLEFRHNSYDDAPFYGFVGLASYDLSPYRNSDGSPTTFVISHKNLYGSTISTTIEYDFSVSGQGEPYNTNGSIGSNYH